MANQPKRYKKFVATAATATLVASAIVPAASAASYKDVADNNDHKKNIEAISELGYMGAGDNFRPYESLKRSQVAIILANWAQDVAGLEVPADYKTVQYFKDLPLTADDKLLQSAALVKKYGIFEGSNGNLNGNDAISRQHMALVLNKAYKAVHGTSLEELAGDTSDVVFADESSINKDYLPVVKALKKLGITAPASFNPNGNVTRGQFATFFMQTVNAEKKEEQKAGITSVSAINDTTVEVKFGKAIDEDFIREAEQNTKYFAIYKEGETIRGDVIQSQSISFSEDGKSAEFVLNRTIQSGEKYHVALLDGPDASVANVVHTYGPTVLRGAAAQPNFEVSAVSDKVTLKFNTKMKNSALLVDNYKVYDDGGKLIGDLSDFVTTAAGGEGDWVNAITKKDVEFTLNPAVGTPKLLAGKTYKIKLTTNLETDDNKTLSKDNLVITVKTPSIDEAAPKVSTARVTDTNKIVLVFDKDVQDLNITNLNNLVEVKTATGKKVVTTAIVGAVGVPLAPNEVELTLTSTEDLDQGTTYNVEIPANLVTNAVFPNAANKATSSIKAKAQDSKAVASVTAKLVSDAKDRTKGNLVLTFDQRPTLDSVKAALTNGNISIFDGTDEYKSTLTAATTVKYAGGDTTGKSVIIEGVNATGAFDFGGKSFAPKSGATYNVEIAAGVIEVDGFGTNNPTNQSKLKATINGVSVSEPIVDRVTLESADKMVIEFKSAIDSAVDLNKITVAGYEANQNKFYTAKDLTGSGYFTASVSGNKLTLTAKSGVKFATGADGNGAGTGSNLIKLAQHAVVSAESAISNGEVTIAEAAAAPTDGKIAVTAVNYTSVKFVDNAAPVLLSAQEGTVPTTDLLFTFTENIKVEGAVGPQFRTGGDAAKSSVGTTAVANNNTLNVTFTDAWNDGDTTLLQVTAEYRSGQTIYIADAFGNKVATTKVTGVENK